MKTVKLGIVGLGAIGQLHLKHGLDLANAEVVAVADTAKPALEQGKSLGVKNTFADYNEMFKDPEVDCSHNFVPTHLHLKCSIQAAEAKKAIFLEKPIAVTVEEANEIISAAQQNSVKLMIGYPLRFNKNFIKLKDDMANGLIGDVENAHATYICAGPFVSRADGYGPAPVPDWWFNRKTNRRRRYGGFGCPHN